MPETTTPRTAAVTGAASGVGRAVAHRLAEDGYTVHLIDRDAEKGAAAAQSVSAVSAARFFASDVSHPEEIAKTFESIGSLGPLDVLVCCAHQVCEKPVEDITEADWDAVIGTNLDGGFFTAQAAIPHMLRASDPVMVHVSSIHGRIGSGAHAAYSASMAGLAALDRCLAAELQDHSVRCCTVSPYTVLTESNRSRLSEAGWGDLQRQTVLNDDIMSPEELADVIALITSPDGRVLNACDSAVDGGMHIFRERPTVSAYA